MLQKILWSIILFLIIYILLIFKAPPIAGIIEKLIGFNGFNQFVLSFKSTFDETITNIPSQEELQNTYNTVHSGAIELKDTIETGIEITREQIDAFRSTMSGAESTYNDLKDGFNDAKDFIDTNSGIVDDIHNTINTLSGINEAF